METSAKEHPKNNGLFPEWSKTPEFSPIRTENGEQLPDDLPCSDENKFISLNFTESINSNTKRDFKHPEKNIFGVPSNDLKSNSTHEVDLMFCEADGVNDKNKPEYFYNKDTNIGYLQQRCCPKSLESYFENKIYFLPYFDKGYSNSFRKIDSYFNKTNFKLSYISESGNVSKVLLDFYTVIDSFSKVENSKCSLLNLLKKEKCNFSSNAFHKEVSLSEKGSKVNQSKLNLKHSYDTYLIKNYGQLCFPMQKKIMCNVPKQDSTSDKIYTIFTKNRRISKGAQKYHKNSQYFQHKCILRNYNISGEFNLTSNTDSDCESDISDEWEILPELKLSGKRTSSKLVEIRKRVERALAKGYDELHQKEQRHLRFIDKCQQICDQTFSFQDFNKIYSAEINENGKISEFVNKTELFSASDFESEEYTGILAEYETDSYTVADEVIVGTSVSPMDINDFSPNFRAVIETNLLPERQTEADVGLASEQEAITGTGMYLEANTGINLETDTDISSEVDSSIYLADDTNISSEADSSIFLEANSNIYSEASTSIYSKAGTNIYSEAGTSIYLEADTDISLESDKCSSLEADLGISSPGNTGLEGDTGFSSDAVPRALSECKVINNCNPMQNSAANQTYRFIEILDKLIDRAPRLTVPLSFTLGIVAAVFRKK